MGLLLVGLAVGLAIGFALGRRRPEAAPVAPLAARPDPAAPLATPNKRGRKAGLTEADFQPSDDILDRLRQAWEATGSVVAEDSSVAPVVAPSPPPEPAPEPEPEPEPVERSPSTDPVLDDTMRRVFARLEASRSGKESDPMADSPEEPAPSAAPGAGTVTEAITELEADGYGEDLRFDHGQTVCRQCGTVHTTETIEVDRVLRFEGPSDPADEAIVLALHCPTCGAKGAVVSAFGPDADPELADAFVYLSSKARHR